MNKKKYLSPTSNVINFASETALLSGSIKMTISNDDDETVSENSDLWSNNRSEFSFWECEE